MDFLIRLCVYGLHRQIFKWADRNSRTTCGTFSEFQTESGTGLGVFGRHYLNRIDF